MAHIKTPTLRMILTALFMFVSLHSARALEVGQKAPEFELESSKGGKLKLSSLRGKNVLINIYVLDFNPTWIQDLQASGSDNYSLFQAENTEVLGMSVNTPFSQKAFAEVAKINYPLLADPTGQTMTSFGVFDAARRQAKRSYIIIDKEGVVRYLNIRPGNGPADLLTTDTLLNEVKKVNRGSWIKNEWRKNNEHKDSTR
jgi:mycoredoxin-dependent peroxiredoxin